jgi:hypothetical protein
MYSFKYNNKMQRYTVFFITVDALHVSGGFSAHHQELKNCTHSIWYVPGFLAGTVSVVGLEHFQCEYGNEITGSINAGNFLTSCKTD